MSSDKGDRQIDPALWQEGGKKKDGKNFTCTAISTVNFSMENVPLEYRQCYFFQADKY